MVKTYIKKAKSNETFFLYRKFCLNRSFPVFYSKDLAKTEKTQFAIRIKKKLIVRTVWTVLIIIMNEFMAKYIVFSFFIKYLIFFDIRLDTLY